MNFILTTISTLTVFGGVVLLVLAPLARRRRRADIRSIQVQIDKRNRLLSKMKLQ
jgi:hypothetical protein